MSSPLFQEIPSAKPDPILGLTEAFRSDPSPMKVNLGVGVYQDGEGRMPILESVRQATKLWAAQEDTKTYLPIDGVPAYTLATQMLLFGADSPLIAQKRIATLQTVGGSGALRIGIEFIKRFFPGSTMYLSDPSWENHRVIFEASGMTVATYPYYDPATSGLRRTEMLDALRVLPTRSAVLLHVCCHNPTGVDIDMETWRAIAGICAERELIPFLDCAYQGFAEGVEADAAPIRLFAEQGLSFLVSSSFAKSLGLYRERVGALSIITASSGEAAHAMSQMKRIVRSQYSSPPSFGAQVAAIVLGTPELRAMWDTELNQMRERIQTMRHAFVTKLKEVLPERDFSFILKQRGMFSYSGLSPDVIGALRDKYHIYALDSGRICIAAMNQKNITYVCDAIASIIGKT